MYKIGFLGELKKIPEIAKYIYEENIEKLNEFFNKGLELNKSIELQFSCYKKKLTLLQFSLFSNKEKSIRWLMSKNVKIGKGQFSDLSIAIRECSLEIVEDLIKSGALKNLRKKSLKRLYLDIHFTKKMNYIKVLEKNGITVKKYGGDAFRLAIFDQNKKEAEIYLKYGVNVNYNEPDEIFPCASTPLIAAVERNNMDIVKWLLDNNADLKLENKNGERAYIKALESGYYELAEYIKQLESRELFLS